MASAGEAQQFTYAEVAPWPGFVQAPCAASASLIPVLDAPSSEWDITMKIFVAMLMFAIATSIHAAQPSKPDPGDLPEFFAGTWTLKGAESTFRETCAWLSPNSYLVCNGSDSSSRIPAKWITLLGYSHALDTYNFSAFDSSGAKIVYSGWLRGEVWVFTSEQAIGTELVRFQSTITPTKNGYVLREEKSVNGASWVVVNDEEHIRLSKETR